MKTIKLKITTPEKVVLEEDVSSISLPTENGEITVLPDHIALLTSIMPGEILARSAKGEISMAVSGGFMEFHDNEMNILADTAERAEEIDLERAEKARKRAEEAKQQAGRSLDEKQYALVVSRIEKNLARIRVAKRHRHRERN